MANCGNMPKKNYYPPELPAGEMLGVEGAAKMLGAHPNSIRRWANSGRLRYFLDVNGWRKFKIEDILRFKDELERLV